MPRPLNTYHCPHCNKPFLGWDKYNAHIREVTKKEKAGGWKCHFCKEVLTSKRVLALHEKAKHSKALRAKWREGHKRKRAMEGHECSFCLVGMHCGKCACCIGTDVKVNDKRGLMKGYLRRKNEVK